MNITPVTPQASKAEELAALKKVASLFTVGTYLNSLFSDRLIDWAEGEMRNDFTCNVMEMFDGLKLELHKATADTAKAQAEAEQAYRKLEDVSRDRDEWHRKFESALESCESLSNDLATLSDDYDILEDKYAREMAEAQLEIITLKARLFDLLYPGMSDRLSK